MVVCLEKSDEYRKKQKVLKNRHSAPLNIINTVGLTRALFSDAGTLCLISV